MLICPATGKRCVDDLCYTGSLTLCGYDAGAYLVEDMKDDEDLEQGEETGA